MSTEPTMEQAMEQARRELAQEHKEQTHFLAKQIHSAGRATVRSREREARRAEIHKRERAEITRGAAKAQRKLYGREVARKLSADVRYWILRSQRHAWAFAGRDATSEAALVLARGGLSFEIDGERPGLHRRRQLLDLDPGIEGIALTRHVEALDGVDEPIEAFERLVSEVEARRMAERNRRADEAAQRRREDRETALYGTTLDADEE